MLNSMGFSRFFHPQWYPNGQIPRCTHTTHSFPRQETGSRSRTGGRRSSCETPPRYSSSGRSTARDLSLTHPPLEWTFHVNSDGRKKKHQKPSKTDGFSGFLMKIWFKMDGHKILEREIVLLCDGMGINWEYRCPILRYKPCRGDFE